MKKGFKHTEETKKRMSQSASGKNNSQFGTHHSEEWKRKMIESRKGYKHSIETKKKLSLAKLGDKNPSKRLDVRKKMSKAKKGRPAHNKGVPMSEEQKKKLSEDNKRRVALGIHPLWKGGIQYEPYSSEFTPLLKEEIKKRDRYTCQMCKIIPETLCIHHIDYNKKNGKTNNLIALCRSCHTKTNHNREKWIVYFRDKQILWT